MINTSEISPQQHKALEQSAIRLKVEKLEAWMYKYRYDYFKRNERVEVIALLWDAYKEQKKLFN